MTTPSDPAVAGAADLQHSVDRLDQDIRGLTNAIQGMSNGNGTSTSPAMSQTFASQGVTFTNGSQGTSYGAGLGGFGFGGGGGGIFGGGSGGQGGTNPYSMGQGIANAATSVVNGQFLLGAQQLNDQAVINTYGYTQAGFWNASQGGAIRTAFGGGSGRGLTLNNMATSASDARYGATLLSQVSGQANYTAPQSGPYGRGNNPFLSAAGIAMANPGLGMTNSASTSASWFNASTSYNLMMMGISTTPLQLGTGKSQNMNDVQAAIGQRFGFQGFNAKTGTFDPNNLAANLNNPLFQMQIMQATGMNQQQYNAWAQSWTQQNQWAVRGKTTMNQMQNEISQYMNGSSAQQGAAQKWLQGHGVSQSLLQSMTQAQAGQTATEAGGNAAFTKGLQAATSVVEKFTRALSAGLQAMGSTAGFAGAIGSLNSSGVSGAGAGGVSNTILASIASAAQSLSKDVSTFSADVTSYQNAASTQSLSGGGGGGNSGGGISSSGAGGNPSSNKALAQSIAGAMGKRGWTSGQQWKDWVSLWNRESGWQNKIANPSGALGIAQALGHDPGHTSKGSPISVFVTGGVGHVTRSYDEYGPDYATAAQARAANNGDPTAQIIWGINYLAGRYGSPSKALQHENMHGWYADGTSSAKAGLALVGERGPELVSLAGGQSIVSASKTAQMMQPSYSGAGYLLQNSARASGGVTITFAKGAITLTSTGGTSGYHTSGDVQATAAQLTQAVEISLSKSSVIRNIAAGVTSA